MTKIRHNSIRHSVLLGLLIFLLGVNPAGKTLAAPPSLADFRADYLINIAKLVTRISEHQSQSNNYHLCVMGRDDDLLAALRVRAEVRIHQKKFQLANYFDPLYLGACDAVYIARSEQLVIGDLLEGLSNQPVLTVSDIEGFVDAGGMFELSVTQGRLVFKANPSCARQKKLKVNSGLMALSANKSELSAMKCK